MKILIAVPCNRTILVPTADTICKLLKQPDYESEARFEESIYVHNNRNRLVQYAQDNGFTHLFFIDHDMVLPADMITRLLANDKDVIGGAYNYRHLPKEPILADKRNGKTFLIDPLMVPKSLFKLWAIGTGCLLIKMSVFEKLTKPYFEYKLMDSGEFMSEDFYFCDKLEKAGVEVWCSPEIPTAHIGDAYY